jgi:MoaD family protein
MKVKVKLVGRYIDVVGNKEVDVEVKDGDTIWHVVEVFVKQYPEIEKDKKFVMISKNNVYTNFESKIADGDEVTISPPIVAGG